MIDYTEIAHDSDLWELFARDLLQELGFHVEVPPDRGADAGRDILVTEEIRGLTYVGRVRWLVSCKHFATSGKSVNEADDERNILERLGSFNAQGFLGFYSTIASAGLNRRLSELVNERKIDAYRVFDGKLIENHLVTAGFSKLMLRYFPESYRKSRPAHRLLGEYQPLPCGNCGKDLLHSLVADNAQPIYARVYRRTASDARRNIEDIYVACKGECDRELRGRVENGDRLTDWADLSDLTIPIEFLRWVFANMNCIRNGSNVYSDEAYSKLKDLILSMSQLVLRYTSDAERERVRELMNIPVL